ncbi:MAG: hypothetical protein ACI8YQ_002434, partial [Polaribacter sp.]
MRVLYSLLFALCCFIPFANAQQRDCGTMEYLEQQIETDPKRAAKMEQIENATKAFLSDPNRVIEGILTIPVVFHVVWNTAAENLSESQINSQLQILTDDFRRFNSDADGTWPQAADSEIEFCLATSDPDGNAHSGITRTNTSVTSFGGNDNVKFNSTGGHDAWPAGDYMNFWVCDLSGGLLGYAQFPGGPANTDGIVCDYQYVGDEGTATPPYELGRTATHEVGHWLNLRHIWGDGGCGVDDQVADTPLSDASNGGCPTTHQSCGSVDMVQNYMDYTYDGCMNLLTLGQKNRMRALFDPGGFRASLLESTACGPVTPPTCDDGLQNGQETGVDCGGPDCPECPPCPGTDVTMTILLDDYPEETTWTLVDANGVTVASGGPYGSFPDGATVEEVICLEDGCYDYTIFDSAGDGLCCGYGEGNYQLTDPDGNVLASGAEFGSEETTNFCVSGVISGCTDPNAHNYNPDAVEDDGSCETCSDGILNGDEEDVDCGGVLCAPCAILGCTDPDAHNYNVEATEDDGSCETCDDNILNGDEEDVDCGGVLCFPCAIPGCTDPDAHNYNPNATDDDGTCETCTDGVQNGDETDIDCGGSLCDACSVPGCTDQSAHNYNQDATEDDGSCETCSDGVQNGDETDVDCGGSLCDACSVPGCTDQSAHNYNPDATEDDGSCETCSDAVMNGDETDVDCGGSLCAPCGEPVVEGCTNPDAHNYDQNANQDDGSCVTCSDGLQNGDETDVDCGGSLCDACLIPGCTNPDAHNYNLEATVDDGSCETCTDGVQNGDETDVDCGGSLCIPCGGTCAGTVANLTIELDRYPEETTWTLGSTNGNIIAEGGPYGNLADYATVVEEFCLPAGCYNFIIYDSYADGICCAYGNGSYLFIGNNSTTLASGGEFGEFESTIFCLGGAEPIEGCMEETAHNYNPVADVDDGSCETCYDNEQNGDEAGVDCGGELCTPCNIDNCLYENINFSQFDSGWGIWNDGGSDCRRSSSDANYAYSNPRCVRLRDNSSSSHTTTDNLGLSFYDELTVDFTFIARSMENNEDFWLQISTDGGSSYATVAEWARGSEFQNDVRYFESVTIEGPFTNATRLRFRCDASSNGDRVYLDDVLVTGCNNGEGNTRIITEEAITA